VTLADRLDDIAAQWPKCRRSVLGCLQGTSERKDRSALLFLVSEEK
jgi:hypothetical protein